MLYTRLHEIATLYARDLLPLLDHCIVTKLDVIPHEVLPTAYTTDEAATINGFFSLPWPVFGIEDAASFTMLIETERKSPQIGLGGQWIFLDCVSAEGNEDAVRDTLEDKLFTREVLKTAPAGNLYVAYGRIQIQATDTGRWTVATALDRYLIGNRDRATGLTDPGEIPPHKQELYRRLVGAASKNVVTCMDEIVWLQNRPRFGGWPKLASMEQRFLRAYPDGLIEITDPPKPEEIL